MELNRAKRKWLPRVDNVQTAFNHNPKLMLMLPPRVEQNRWFRCKNRQKLISKQQSCYYFRASTPLLSTCFYIKRFATYSLEVHFGRFTCGFMVTFMICSESRERVNHRPYLALKVYTIHKPRGFLAWPTYHELISTAAFFLQRHPFLVLFKVFPLGRLQVEPRIGKRLDMG